MPGKAAYHLFDWAYLRSQDHNCRHSNAESAQ